MAQGHSQVSVGAATAIATSLGAMYGDRASVGKTHLWVYVLCRATASTTAAILEREPMSSYIN